MVIRTFDLLACERTELVKFFHWSAKKYQVEIFRGRRSSFFNYNVRQAARPARRFLVTSTCTSPAIFVY